MKKILLFIFVAALISGLTGCKTLMVVSADFGVDNSLDDRDKLEAVMQNSGMTRVINESANDEAGRFRVDGIIFSSFFLEDYPRFDVTVSYTPANGSLKFHGRERNPGKFGAPAQECISKIIEHTKEAFGDNIEIKIW